MVKRPVPTQRGPSVEEQSLALALTALHETPVHNRKNLAIKIAKRLGGTADILIDLLYEAGPERTADISLVLQQMPESIIPQLIAALGSSDQFLQGAAITELARRGESAIEQVLRVLGAEDQFVAGGAAAVIRKIGIPAVPWLARAIDPQSPSFSTMALTLLSEIDVDYLSKLSALLADGLGSSDPFKASSAMQAYRNMGSGAAGELVDYLGDPNPFLQNNAAEVIVTYGIDAVPYLISGLGATNQFTQQNCFLILKRIGAEAAPMLLRAMESSSNPVLRGNGRRLLSEYRAAPTDNKKRWWHLLG